MDNHIGELVSIDFFTVPMATFRILFVLIVLAHDRRRIVHFNVTDHPTAEWTAQQMVEAMGDGKSPRYLIRDQDGVYGLAFRDRVKALEIDEIVIAPRSPWQNLYAERIIGTLRRECLDHVVVISENHLRRIMRRYLYYYHGARTHLALEKDAPEPRYVQPPEQGKVIEIPEVGGLHNRYERRAAQFQGSGAAISRFLSYRADAPALHLLPSLDYAADRSRPQALVRASPAPSALSNFTRRRFCPAAKNRSAMILAKHRRPSPRWHAPGSMQR